MTSEAYHEPIDSLTGDVIERHRAIQSLVEELDAIDWYDQRVSATQDSELRAVLAHHRDEEREHAAMLIEWLRRIDPAWDEVLRAYLFRNDAIVAVEATETDTRPAPPNLELGNLQLGSLHLGNLHGARAR